MVSSAQTEPVDRFPELYYGAYATTWQNTFWMGVGTAKCPLDLWIYQEILWDTQPDLIIESGTAHGGSALFLASIFDLLGSGSVATVDVIDDPGRPAQPRIRYLSGSSTDPEIVAELEALAAESSRVMVILDSDHRSDHVAQELRLYAPLVTEGCYLIVEDTNLNGRPVMPEFGP
jgi:cephalosporin hydroxylase